jgi:hypothetical protein
METPKEAMWEAYVLLANFFDIPVVEQPAVDKTTAQYRLLKQELISKVSSAPTTQKVVKHVTKKTETSLMMTTATDLVLTHSDNRLILNFELEGLRRAMIPRPFGSEVIPAVSWFRPTAVIIGPNFAYCDSYRVGGSYIAKFPGVLPKPGGDFARYSEQLFSSKRDYPLCRYVTFNEFAHSSRVGQHEDLTHLPPPGPFGYADPVFARPFFLYEIVTNFMEDEVKVYFREFNLLGMTLPKNFVTLNVGQFSKDRVKGTPIVAVGYGKSTDFHQRAMLLHDELVLINSPFSRSLASNSQFVTSGCKSIIEMSFNPYIPSGFHSCSGHCPLASLMAKVLVRVLKGFSLAFARYPRPHDSGVLVIATPGVTDVRFVARTIESVIFKSALNNAARGIAESTGILAYEAKSPFIITNEGCCGELGHASLQLGYARVAKEKAQSRKKKAEVDKADYGKIFSPIGE